MAHAAEAAYEPFPVFKAQDILPPELQKGPDFFVENDVGNDGYMYHFFVDSRFGRFEAVGLPMLVKRIHEVQALAVLAEMTTAGIAVNTGKNVGSKAVSSTVEGARSFSRRASNPEELSAMVKSVPGGVVNLFSLAAETVQSGAALVTGAGTGAAETGEGAKDTSSQLTEQATGLALKYSGYSEASSALARQLEIDPYTDNEKLLSEIQRVARVQATVGFAGRVVPSPPAIPGIGEANKWLDKIEEVSLYDDPGKIVELNNKIMKTLGIEEKDALAFVNNRFFTPTAQTLFLDALQSLEQLENHTELLNMANNARSRAGAWYYVYAVQHLRALHQEKALRRISTEMKIPSAVNAGGELLIPLPVDHLVWTRQVETVLGEACEGRSRDGKGNGCAVIVAGTVSQICMEKLQGMGLKVTEKAGYM